MVSVEVWRVVCLLKCRLRLLTEAVNSVRVDSKAKQSVIQAMTKRVLFQRRLGASASFAHVFLRKYAGVAVKVLMREAG
ncbi:hypothetical protein TNCV_3290831 [Trichonephila clavipes]|nr:hypothetical protein TNCV_3290831 [Trichonephila clavipes]